MNTSDQSVGAVREVPALRPGLHGLTAIERARIFRLVIDRPQNEVAELIEVLVEALKGARVQLPKGHAGDRCARAIAKATGA